MKRAILGMLAVGSLVTLLSMVAGAFDLSSATRALLITGAGLILVTAIDGLRRGVDEASLATVSAAAPERPGRPTDPHASSPTPPAPPTRPAAAPANTSPSDTGSPADTRPSEKPIEDDDGLVIDLRDPDGNEGARVVEQLLADGQLSRSDGPISDDDVPRIMMAALVD